VNTLKKKVVMRKKTDAGFTLIELLIVIVILAILAAIVVFAVGTTGTNAAKSACQADGKSVETAIEAYRAQNNNSYPSSITQLTANGTAAPSGAPYLRQLPGTAHYTIAIDTAGNVLVGPAGGTASANFDTASDPCSVAS
jgi:general secretion pathway protein G